MQLSIPRLLSINNGINNINNSSNSNNNNCNVRRHYHRFQYFADNSKLSPTFLQSLCSKLAHNTLTELELGLDSDKNKCEKNSSTTTHHQNNNNNNNNKRINSLEYDLKSKRDIDHLVYVIQNHYLPQVRQDKYTCLESIRIGWQLPRSVIVSLLQDVLPLLLLSSTSFSLSSPSSSSSSSLQQYSSHRPNFITIKKLQLVLADSCWIPESIFRHLIHSCTALESLDIRSTRILRQQKISSENSNSRKSSGSRFCSIIDCIIRSPFENNDKDTNATTTIPLAPISPIPEMTITMAMSKTLTTLQLIDCDVRTEQVEELCITLYKDTRRYQCCGNRVIPPLKVLSLRHNRNLVGTYRLFTIIFQLLTGLLSLDISLCDFGPIEGNNLLHALRKRLLLNSTTESTPSPNTENNPRTATSMSSKDDSQSTTGVNMSTQSSTPQQWPPPLALRRLIVAGNYRMGPAIPELVEVVCGSTNTESHDDDNDDDDNNSSGMKGSASTSSTSTVTARTTKNQILELDCSFCDVQNIALTEVFKHLANASPSACQLRTFRMQGCRIKKEDTTNALVKCIRQNKTLRSLMLHPPADSPSAITHTTSSTTEVNTQDTASLFPYSYPDPYALDLPSLIAIGKALKNNYHLETLYVAYVDTPSRSRATSHHQQRPPLSARDVTTAWQFWLQLNCCGRRQLLSNPETSQEPSNIRLSCNSRSSIEWSSVLAKAARYKDPSILFWLVQNGAEMF